MTLFWNRTGYCVQRIEISEERLVSGVKDHQVGKETSQLSGFGEEPKHVKLFCEREALDWVKPSQAKPTLKWIDIWLILPVAYACLKD